MEAHELKLAAFAAAEQALADNVNAGSKTFGEASVLNIAAAAYLDGYNAGHKDAMEATLQIVTEALS